MIQIELAAVAMLFLTVIGAIISITRYVTGLQYKIREEKLLSEKDLLQQKYSDLEARYQELADEIAVTRRIGTVVLAKKLEIDDDLSVVIKSMRATAGSIYIPLTSQSTSELIGLAFLSIQPFGKHAAALKRKIIPPQSLAGRCFSTGEPFVSSNSKQDPAHFDKADKVSGFRTEDTLNYPLRNQGQIVGVLQLLNKRGEERFGNEDLVRVEPFADSIASKVAEFVRMPNSLEILGITPDREAEYATIMFCDLTRSSALFEELNAMAAIQNLNEFFERMCDIVFDKGGTVDKYTGDGVMFRFNVPRQLFDHYVKAVEAAMEMCISFEKLKQDWIILGEPITRIYIRIGIAYGSVYQALIGHPQYQYLTVFGQAVNVASNLCEAASRNRNVIVVDENLRMKLIDSGIPQSVFNPLPIESLGKAKSFIRHAYELDSIRFLRR